jgi:hypothetical protein
MTGLPAEFHMESCCYALITNATTTTTKVSPSP